MIRFDERLRIPAWIAAIALAGVLASCNMSGTPDTTAPSVDAWTPMIVGMELAETNERVTATFSEAIDPATLDTTSFQLTSTGAINVPGAVSYHAGTYTATYTPTGGLAINTTYTATISTNVTDLAGNALEDDVTWTFTTDAVATVVTGVVELASAGQFVLLSEAGISATAGTAITGDIGVSPIDLTAITGFNETLDASGEFATSALVNGDIYAANLTEPTPTLLTGAINAMQTAYTDAAGRTLPDATELAAGLIGGLNLAPGVYTWGTNVLIDTDLTLTGNATDVWILQIAQDLTLANGISIELAGGALPENVFWQVAGQATLGTTSTMKGIVLSKTAVVMATGAVLDGRAYAQTEITLDAATVTQP